MDAVLNGLYRIQESDVERVAGMLGRSFHDDPLMIYAYAEGERNEEDSNNFFLAAVKYCLKYGMVYAPTAGIEGAALWLPSNKCPITFSRMLRTSSLWSMLKMIRKIGIERINRLARIGGSLDKAHTRLTAFDHWYLQTLGVDPEYQGRGYASRLLRPMFTRFDEKGMPCYLDTLNEKNVTIYEHLGFEVLEKSNIPDTDITFWAMLRKPR